MSLVLGPANIAGMMIRDKDAGVLGWALVGLALDHLALFDHDLRWANGLVEHAVVMLRSVNLGGAEVTNVPASISPHMNVGLLGLSFFNHFTYNVDAAQGVVTLVPNALDETGGIRGGRSEAQWRAEYKNIHYRRVAVENERERTPPHHTREHRRLEAMLEELDRQEELLEGEADQARVPMVWRN